MDLLGAHEAEAADTRLHLPMVLIQDFGISLELDTEHQFLPLLGGLDALRRELGVSRDEADGRGNDVLGNGIGDDARLVAQRELARLIRGQVDRHVDVLEVEDGQNALPCRNHLTGAGEPVLHPSTPWRHEHQVGQNRLQPLDIGLSRLDCRLSLVTLGVGRNICGFRRFEFVAALVHRLLRYIPVLN